jgi:DNA-directed RNA polymerase specialized sigma24 family protein
VSIAERDFLSDPHAVTRCLVTYPDCLQPSTGSVLSFSGLKRKDRGDGLRAELTNGLELRVELNRRMQLLEERDRQLLFLWYVRHLHVDEIADQLGLSRRQCFRRRASAIRTIVEAGKPQAAA